MATIKLKFRNQESVYSFHRQDITLLNEAGRAASIGF